MTYTPGPAGRPVARWRCWRARRGGASASAITSSALSAPRSWARPISATSTSAVASASGSARWHGRTVTSKRSDTLARSKRASRPASRRRASATVSSTRMPRRVPSSAHERAVEHADVEGRVVGDEDAAAREREQLGERRAQRAGAREIAIADARDLRDARRHRDARVDQAREPCHLLAALEPHGADLDDARARADAGRLEVDDRPGRLGQRRARRRREPDEADAAVVVAHEARVVLHDLLEHAPRQLARHARQRQERTGRPLGRQRLAALLDQCRQPVSRTQLQLERRDARPAGGWRPSSHANVCSQIWRTPPPAAC